MEKIVSSTSEKIKAFARPDNKDYRNLIKQLILQSMTKLLEPMCFIQVRKIDVEFVKTMLKVCEAEYAKILLEATGDEYNCTLEVDEHTYLNNER